MNRREFWIPLAVFGLALAFALVSGLVRASRGNPWLIRRKLKLGALLLGLTWSASGCDGPVATCYAPLPPDRVDFDAQFEGGTGLLLDLSQGRELSGTIAGRSSSAYAFQLVDQDAEFLRGDLIPSDGAFDETTEAFRLLLDAENLPATGTLRLFRGAAADIDPSELLYEATLTVTSAQ